MPGLTRECWYGSWVRGKGPSTGSQGPWAMPAMGLQLEHEFCGHVRGTVVWGPSIGFPAFWIFLSVPTDIHLLGDLGDTVASPVSAAVSAAPQR